MARNIRANRFFSAQALERRQLLSAAVVGVFPAAPPSPAASPAVGPAAPAVTYPLSDVPQLSSDPGAKVNVYLDFTGDTVNSWGYNPATGKPYDPGVIPAYDSDGDPTTFSSTELADIQAIWAGVAEKYSPFTVNVTTVKPSNTAHGSMFQMDIGGTNSWYSATAGGVALVGSFTNTSLSNIDFDFSNQGGSSSTNIVYLATDAAHETGHGLGLNHQGTVSNGVVTEYSNGSSTTAPIMGNAGNIPGVRGIWFNGTETGVDSNGNPIVLAASQDDLSIITSTTNGISYKTNTSTYSNPTTMLFYNNGSLLSGYGGTIITSGDTDFYRFQAQGPTANFAITETTPLGMLAPAAIIQTSGESTIAYSVNSNTGCTISASGMTPGAYYFLVVGGQGGYGDIGQYQISSGYSSSFAYQAGNTLYVDGYDNNSNAITIGVGTGVSAGSYVLSDTALGGTASISFTRSGISSIYVYLGTAANTIDVGNGSLANIAPVTVTGPTGTDALSIDDSESPTIGAYYITVSGVDEVVTEGSFTATFDSAVTGVTLATSDAAADVVNVSATILPTTVQGQASEYVDAGTGSSATTLAAGLTVTNPPNFTNLTIDDSSDTTARGTVYLSNGELTGLSPQPIIWTPGDVNSLTISGGSGGNGYYITTSLPTSYQTDILMGSGNDLLDIDNGVSANLFVNGESGTDQVNVYEGTTTAATYNFSSTGFSRAGLSVAVTSVESLALQTGYTTNTVNVPALPSAAVSIYVSPGSVTAVDVGAGTHVLPSLAYGLDLVEQGTINLMLDDGSDTSPGTNIITASTFQTSTGTLTYAALTVDDIASTSDSFLNTVDIYGTSPVTTYTINANDAALVSIGQNSNISGVQTSQIFNPNVLTINDADDIAVFDSGDPAARTYTLSSGSLNVAGLLQVDYTALGTPLLLEGANGGDTFNIQSTSIQNPVTVLGGLGNDNFYVGSTTVTGGLLYTLTSNITVNGGSGNDNLTLYDPDYGPVEITPTVVAPLVGTTPYSQTTYSNFKSLTLDYGTNTSGGLITVTGTAAGTPVTVADSNGTDTLDVDQTAPTAPVTFDLSTGGDAINVDAPGMGTGPAEVDFTGSQRIGQLTIGTAGQAVVTTGAKKLLETTGISVTGNGRLDLTANDLDVLAGSLTAVNALVRSGYNLTGGGKWNGPGIVSSAAAGDTTHLTALAVVQNNQGGQALFSGTRMFDQFIPGAADILVKYTYFGDANLDGKVDGSDYSLIDAGYKSHGTLTGWYNGDFNYDGSVDGSDYSVIDNAFNNQRTAIPSAVVAAVPSVIPVVATAAAVIQPASPAAPPAGRVIPQQPATPPVFSTTTDAADLLQLLKRSHKRIDLG
jgi:hypothetical protein